MLPAPRFCLGPASQCPTIDELGDQIMAAVAFTGVIYGQNVDD
jgi:hypothetical protein